MQESNPIFNLATSGFLLNYYNGKGEAYKWTKNLRKQFERFSATLQKSLLVLQSEKLAFTRIFWEQMNPRATSLATTFASRDSELLGNFSYTQNKEKSLVFKQ